MGIVEFAGKLGVMGSGHIPHHIVENLKIFIKHNLYSQVF